MTTSPIQPKRLPGWYADPYNPDQPRYWDGRRFWRPEIPAPHDSGSPGAGEYCPADSTSTAASAPSTEPRDTQLARSTSPDRAATPALVDGEGMIGAQPAQQNPPTAGWYVFPDRQGEPSYWDGCRWRVEEPVSQTELARTRAHRALAVMAVWALSLVAGFLGAGTGSGTIAGALVAVLFLAPWVALGFAIAAGSAAAAATPPGVRGGPVQRLIGWAFASAVLGLCGTGALVLLALAASADYL